MGDAPLPIAALVLRARNAKSAKERHDLAYFGWEASVRLAVAAQPPEDRARLTMPSTGDWVAALAADDQILDDRALLAVHGLLAEEGLGRAATPRSTNVVRLLAGLPAYRNAVLGHGAVRAPAFYERAGEVLAAGLEALWRLGVLWPADARLVHVESVEIDGDARRARVLDLSGAAARVIDPRGTSINADVLPRRLHVERGGAYRSLHPWLVFEVAELRERVLFFNGRGRAARYLDYVGGEQVKGAALAALCPTVEADLDAAMLRGRADEPAEARDPNRFGDYRLLGKLGEGGMGVVYLARQDSLDRLVALKMLPAGATDDAVAVARFKREVAALARCEHPNVVKILAAGEVDGRSYYAMEVVEGADLAEVSRALSTGSDLDQAISTASDRVRKARIDAFADIPRIEQEVALPRDGGRVLAEMFRDAARALDHLHAQGILHRDVKPANLMVTAGDHRVVLMDLGLASLGDGSQSITRDKSSILGTLRYLPPEQLQRSLLSLDRRADLYSLGATFYELLTGKPFFDGDSEARLIEQVLREQPVAPRIANPAVPRDLALIVAKATEKDPKQRYDDAEALARDLDAYLDGRPISARPPSVAYLLRLAIQRHRAIAATVAIALVLATAGATWFLIRERRLRGAAERARDEARASEVRTQRALARGGAEQGRQELLAHRPGRAAAYLAAVYPRLADDPAVRFLLADAMRDVERARATLRGHTAEIRTAVFSPDGQRVVTASEDHTARMWDAATGGSLATLAGHTQRLRSAAFSPDGTRVVTASADRTARVWDAATGRSLATLDGHTEAVRSAAFSPDGTRVVTASADHTARVWDAATGRPLATLQGHADAVGSVAFDVGGARVVTASADRTARVWDAATGGVLATLDGHTDALWSASFSLDGARVITASADHTARVWDAATGRMLATLDRHTDVVRSAAFSPDGSRVVTASWDESAGLWDAATGRLLAILGGHTGVLLSATFSPDGTRVVTAGADRTARLWDAATGRALATLDGHTDAVFSATFSPDGTAVVTAGADRTARLWNAAAGRSLATFGHTASVWSSAFTSDGTRVVTASDDHTARVWDAITGRELATLAGHTDGVVSAAFAPDGTRVVTTSKDHSARLWDAYSGGFLASLDGHVDTVWHAAFSADGTRIVTASQDRTARLWDAATGRAIATLEGHTDLVSLVAFSPDGTRVVTASADHTARVWDVGGGPVTILAGHTGPVASAAFSPDGRHVITASDDRTARVWDASTGRAGARFDGHTDALWSAAYSPDGRQVVTASWDSTARLWDATTGRPSSTLDGHADVVASAVFSPDATRVVTASNDHTARIWDAATGRALATLEGHTDVVWSAVFSPDGQRVVTASPDGTARLWDVHLETRRPAEIGAIVAAQVPWEIEDGDLLPRR